ncbi:hypothetical protein CMQ_8266 [Grosmannia clavigera kw1407]|uniref:Uncharacterized protein n=1 Tax=Grosmannia clavigera (strain kw1407 / UAMH 11150) TaxID=655863 RepID=F0XKI9_GROCL|nr:uncharacterized protein CMQ_8266 [Grosmannia clavigera kw1407]EFX01800.1 hypothetical protein CMQ_8266 [Grosmannia clavigera kw1407]
MRDARPGYAALLRLSASADGDGYKTTPGQPSRVACFEEADATRPPARAAKQSVQSQEQGATGHGGGREARGKRHRHKWKDNGETQQRRTEAASITQHIHERRTGYRGLIATQQEEQR